jgi:CheY-like chemotaxis protein
MNPRILIVDDNSAIHADFQKILSPPPASAPGLAGSAQMLFGSGPAAITAPEFDLTYASSGEEALTRVQESIAEGRPFALAFMDMQMPPGWNGVETVSHIWKVAPSLRVVFCSAYSDHSWTDIATELGITDRYLVFKKPFESIEILQMAVAMTRPKD